MITYHSIQDILELCEKEQMAFAQVIEHADMEERAVTQEASYAKMQSMYEAMRHADATYDAKLTSASGLVGGDGEKLRAYNEAGKNRRFCTHHIFLYIYNRIDICVRNYHAGDFWI